ncbi:hypothetical protein K438DRAFT_1760499 [Mycena galopus ATCC 62051]|nr:hypothetical protein K438DRAFT_1760499 [Mycena galopus ATCC 62051]
MCPPAHSHENPFARNSCGKNCKAPRNVVRPAKALPVLESGGKCGNCARSKQQGGLSGTKKVTYLGLMYFSATIIAVTQILTSLLPVLSHPQRDKRQKCWLDARARTTRQVSLLVGLIIHEGPQHNELKPRQRGVTVTFNFLSPTRQEISKISGPASTGLPYKGQHWVATFGGSKKRPSKWGELRAAFADTPRLHPAGTAPDSPGVRSSIGDMQTGYDISERGLIESAGNGLGAWRSGIFL